MTDLTALPEDVRKACKRMEEQHLCGSQNSQRDWQTIRAELLRVTEDSKRMGDETMECAQIIGKAICELSGVDPDGMHIGDLPTMCSDYAEGVEEMEIQLEEVAEIWKQRAEAAERELANLRTASSGTTHYDGCWREHRDCAVARAEALEREVAELRAKG